MKRKRFPRGLSLVVPQVLTEAELRLVVGIDQSAPQKAVVEAFVTKPAEFEFGRRYCDDSRH